MLSGQHHEIWERGALAEPVGSLLSRVEEQGVHVAGVHVAQRIGRSPGVELSGVQKLGCVQRAAVHLEVARVESVRAEVRRGRGRLLLDDPGRVPVTRVGEATGGQEARGEAGEVRDGALREAAAWGPALAGGRRRERRVGNAARAHERHG